MGRDLTPNSEVYRQATTACLTAIVLMQVVNVFVCRSPTASVFSQSPFGNRLIMAGIAVEVAMILLIDYTPAGHALFGTASIPWRAWLVVLPFAIAMLALEEARKAYVRFRRS